MKRETVTYDCDVCGNEIDQSDPMSMIGKQVPVRFTTEQTEGRGCDPYWSFEKVDLCEECALKSFSINAAGAMGCNTYWLREQK